MPMILDPYEMLLSQLAMPNSGMLGAAQGAAGVPLPDPSMVEVPAEPSPLAASDPMSAWAVDDPLQAARAAQPQAAPAASSSGARTLALAGLAGQLPGILGGIGRAIDGGPKYRRNLSDERAKREVTSADRAVERFFRALAR